MRRSNATSRVSDLITRSNTSIFLSTEIWLNTGNVHRFLREASPNNFRYFYFTRPGRGGGVAIQFSPQFQRKQILFNHDITTFEFVAADLQHENWDEPILVINLYRPPRGGLKKFLNDLRKILKELSKKYRNTILAGDFNIWVDDIKKGGMFLRFLQDNNLVQHVRGPTHRRNHTLDLVLTRNVEISDLNVQNNNMSDHFTVYFKARPKKTEEEKDEDEKGEDENRK